MLKPQMRGNLNYTLFLLRNLPRQMRTLYWKAQLRPEDRYVSEAAPIIIAGCGRSGTTLLRVILDTHSSICCGPESGLFTKPPAAFKNRRIQRELTRKFDLPREAVQQILNESLSHSEFVDRFFKAYAQAAAKPIWAEKTPANIRQLPFIFEHFPKARIIHMIRDGRDTVCSLRTMPKYLPARGGLRLSRIRKPLASSVERWVGDVRAGLQFRGDSRYTELRYEALVTAPEAALKPLFEFLQLPWEPSVLDFHAVESGSRDATRFPQNQEANQPLNLQAIGRWRRCLADREKSFIQQHAGALLVELGYGSEPDWH
jgi:hypothetical protein